MIGHLTKGLRGSSLGQLRPRKSGYAQSEMQVAHLRLGITFSAVSVHRSEPQKDWEENLYGKGFP